MNRNRLLTRIALVTLLLAAGGSTWAASECSADIKGDFRRDEEHDDFVDKVFALEIKSSAACAKVYYELITTEQLFTGETIKSSQASWQKVTAGTDTAKRITYRIARDSKLVKWEFKFIRCVICGTE